MIFLWSFPSTPINVNAVATKITIPCCPFSTNMVTISVVLYSKTVKIRDIWCVCDHLSIRLDRTSSDQSLGWKRFSASDLFHVFISFTFHLDWTQIHCPHTKLCLVQPLWAETVIMQHECPPSFSNSALQTFQCCWPKKIWATLLSCDRPCCHNWTAVSIFLTVFAFSSFLTFLLTQENADNATPLLQSVLLKL